MKGGLVDSTDGAPGYRFNPYAGAWERDPYQVMPAPDPAPALSAPAPAPAPPKRRAGRPARGDAKRTHRVGLSLSADEHAQWAACAAEDGSSSVARWARDRVASTLGQGAFATPGSGEVAALRADLNRAGNNLNQIARALNVAERGGPEGPSLAEVADTLEQMRRELATIRAWTREQG